MPLPSLKNPPLFPDGLFEKVKEGHRAQMEIKYQQHIQFLNKRIAGLKGVITQLNKKCRQLELKFQQA
jgi:hypothetical protein